MKEDLEFIQQAIQLAKTGMQQGSGGPFGAVIVKDGKIIGQSYNKVYEAIDPTAHAEIAAIRDACQNIESRNLSGSTLYSSCEPCPMCFSAIYFAGIERVVYAASHKDAGEIAGFGMDKLYYELNQPLNNRTIPHQQQERESGLDVFHEWNVLRLR